MERLPDRSPVTGGLRNVEVATTRTSAIDGTAGSLVICGYQVEDLAPQAEVEEVACLLLDGALPSAARAESPPPWEGQALRHARDHDQ